MGVQELLILGVDAVDFDVIRSSDVSVPTFDRLIDDGVTADLESTLPPVTGAAWPAMACGRDPNALGMFDFVNFSRPERREYRPTPSRVDPFWSYLAEAGYSAGISGYPIAPLDKPVDGFVLSWPWYLPDDEPYLAPADFFDGTGIDVESYIHRDITLEYDRIVRDLEDKIEFDERVLDAFEFDVYYSYLDADSIIHTIDSDDHQPLYDVYEILDSGMERLIEHCGDECAVIVVSDHGVSDVWGQFHLDQMLVDEGFLSLSAGTDGGDTSTGLGRHLKRAAKRAVKASGLAPAVRRIFFDSDRRRKRAGLTHQRSLSDVDWEQTQIVQSGEWGKLYTLGDDSTEIKEAVSSSLSSFGDKYGFDICFHRPEDAYRGESHPDAPDLFVTLRKDSQLVVPTYTIKPMASGQSSWFDEWDKPHMNHGKMGVFIAAGPSFKEGIELASRDAIDVAPTILNHILGAVPPDIYGEAVTELYRSESDRIPPDTRFHDLQSQLIEEQSDVGDSIDGVREKLENMGYLE